MWRDNDQRTRGEGEFTVEEVADGKAVVRRHRTGRRSTISVERLLSHAARQRGYTYLGRKR